MKTFSKICIPVLLVIVFLGALKLSGIVNIPPHICSYCEQADYILDLSSDSLQGKAEFKVRAFRRGEFRLLSNQVALTSVIVDGQERPVFEKDGFFVAFMKRGRESTIKLEFAKKIEGIEDKHRLELIVPRSSTCRVKLSGIRGQHIILNGFGFNEFETEDMPDRVSLILPPSDKLDICWQRSKTGDKPARIFAQRYTLIEIKDKSLYYRTICDYRIKDGKVSSLRWRLDPEAKQIEVKADKVHFLKVEPQEKQKIVEVQLISPIKGDYRLELSYSLDYENDLAEVITAQPANVLNEDEYLVIGSGQELQIVPLTEFSLRGISSDEVPAQLVKIAEIPILKAYHRLDSQARLQLAFIRYGQAEGVETVVDKAEYEIYFSPQGQQVVRATFEVRNTHNQFMQLHLPEGTTLCSVRLMDKPVRPLCPKTGMVLIPLEKSIESFSGYVSFPVDICYIVKINGKKERQVSAILPALGVPTSYLKWRLVLPKESRIRWKDMDVYRVEQFSDEKAIRMLEYARARAAEGKLPGEIEEMGEEEAGYFAEAMDVLEEVIQAEEPPDKRPTPEAMPGPQVIGKDKFDTIDFEKLHQKVTTYSKKVAESERERAIRRVKVRGWGGKEGEDRRPPGIYDDIKQQGAGEDIVRKDLSARYSREAQRAYRTGSLEKAQEEISRALQENIAEEQALQLAENVQRLQQIEKREKEEPLPTVEVESISGTISEIPVDMQGQRRELKEKVAERKKEERIYSQIKTYKKGERGRFLEDFGVSFEGGEKDEMATSADIALQVQATPQVGLEKPGKPLLLRYNLILVPNDLSRRIGTVFENRAEPVSQTANDDYSNWRNSANFHCLNAPNIDGYNRMNLDSVQENTLIDTLNESSGAGNILASRVVRVDENNVFNIPFATSEGTRYAKVRPVIVDEDYMDFYVSLPRISQDGKLQEEETAVRIKRGQTATIGGISGAVTALGSKNSGLVLMLNGDLLEKMAPEDVENIYARRYLDISMPTGDVYKFEKLLVKANEVLTITMEVRK